MSKFIKLITSSKDIALKDKILKFIKEVGEEAFGGDCGMFAIALAEILKKYNKDCKIVFCSNLEDNEGLTELIYGEPDIYHVAIEIDGIMYDGSGIINENYLKNFVKDEYNRNDFSIHKFNYSSNLDKIILAIRYNTNYYYTPEAFTKEWDNIFKEIV